MPFDTCLAYEACSAESTEGSCGVKAVKGSYTCEAINTCRTCSTFSALGGFCSALGRGLHSFPILLNLSYSVHRMTRLSS